MTTQEIAGRLNVEPSDALTQQMPEVGKIAGQQLRGLGGHRGAPDRRVLFGQPDSVWKRQVRSLRVDPDGREQRFEPRSPIPLIEIAAGFLGGISGGDELDVRPLPELLEAGAFSVGCREEDVGVGKDARAGGRIKKSDSARRS